MQKGQNFRGGFALPTVLIASVVMLIVLSVSVSSVAAIRVTLKTQYYEQLAKIAGESGVAYAKACLAKNANVPLWTDAKPLTPSSDCAGNQLLTPVVSALVIAGGGGGANTGSGGGAGGMLTNNSLTLAQGAYPVTVGAGGGSPSGAGDGYNGGNSVFASLTAIGGGGGRTHGATSSQGIPGGSGGGGNIVTGGSVPTGGNGTAGQGNSGGAGFFQNGWVGTSGGGGGAGGPGIPGGSGPGDGEGGPGAVSSITGAPVTYAGGGASGEVNGSYVPDGGSGGGGIATINGNGGNGAPNSGSGGGGGSYSGAYNQGGSGGSGIVVISYANNGSVNASGGNQVYVSGTNKIHIFRSSGTFNVTALSNSSCPSDPRCSVTVNDTLRSSFSVPKPVVDSSGRALTIPNSGYVELLRSSTGEVWRTYRQPAVQVAAVPDLCSGAASSTLGWQNAVVTTTQESIPNASTAQTIALSNGNVAPGLMYFRKDFTVAEAGAYSLSILTTDPTDVADAYVDGTLIDTAQGTLSTAPVSLTVGCHTITVKVTNRALTSQPARFTAAIQKTGSAPIVATSSSWRVSAGSTEHFSQPDFYADPSIWTPVIDYLTPTAQALNPAWQSTQADVFTGMISPSGNGCGGSCPASSSAYLRDSKDFYLSNSTEIQVSSLCDDDCIVYIDGQVVIANSLWSSINQQTLTLGAGAHHVGLRLYNGGAAVNPAGAAVSVVVKATGQVLTRTDRSWIGSTTWTSGNNTSTADIISYENSFIPSPDEIPRPKTLDVIVVAGGGGGGSNAAGGGGGGGVRYLPNIVFGTGTYTVTVGAGGAGGTNSGTTIAARGQNGGNSAFSIFTAIGGGGGASRDNGPAASSGGSGGGGAGTTAAGREPGAAGTSGQGFAGGAGTPPDQGGAAKGGGGGGAGGPGVPANNSVAGNGGAGFITYISGSLLTFGGGGGGSNTAGDGYLGAATDGGIGGSSTAAPANRGGGGSGVGGGAGGSGVVIVRFKTGSMAVTVTGSPVQTSATIGGIAYTIYTFNASGTFRIGFIY
jgi:septal ring-binding cell division protein DamX